MRKVAFYDLSKEERRKLVEIIELEIKQDLIRGEDENIRKYASDKDTYIRRVVYKAIGKLYREQDIQRKRILEILMSMYKDENEKIRQAVVYTFGEIGKIEANKVELLDVALNDTHHSVRNAVVGALKQIGEKNPQAAIEFARKFLHHSDPKIRKMIVHGIELRGRTHPEDILPLLSELQNDSDKEVRKMIIHVIGQISYKEGCLEKVVSTLKEWENRELVKLATEEILEVHRRYKKFSAKSYEEAKKYIEQEFEGLRCQKI